MIPGPEMISRLHRDQTYSPYHKELEKCGLKNLDAHWIKKKNNNPFYFLTSNNAMYFDT